MIEGFDKEIDSLLRRTAKGESVQATFDAHHLDADEISLFAENALTTKARTRATHHLAECAKCRKILSNLISFNVAAESETIHAEESHIVAVAATAIPWYRRLFAFPQITFAMGALVLVFAGIMAVLVSQNAGDMQNATVARREEVTEKSRGTGGASSDGETQSVETADNNSFTAANVNPAAPVNMNTTAANSTSNSMSTNTTRAADADVSVPAVRQQQLSPESNELTATSEAPKPVTPAAQPPSNTPTLNKSTADMTAGAPPPKDSVQQQRAENDAVKEDMERKREPGRDARNDSSRLGSTQTETAKSMRLKKSAPTDKNKAAGESRSVGGKTFRNVGGIWFDSAYTSQQPIMIRRGSDDYKRLDSGLRSIAENLGGTVVVVWKSRAYRIN